MNLIPTQRLYSLDALRGFDMFWIMGAEDIVNELSKVTGSPFWGAISEQLTHPDWHGFHFYDLIFPLFLFLAGVATPYSTGREFEKGKTREQVMMRVIKRGLLLVLLGVIYNNGLAHIKPIEEIRFASVLGRIGLAYIFANVIYLYASQRWQIIWFWIILVGYWFMFLVGSAPGFPAGDLTMEGNIASYLDRLLLPGKLYLGIHDPEGIISTIPAIATGLLGIYSGTLLKNGSMTMRQKTIRLLLMGISFLVLARFWDLAFPINKNLWTSPFVLYTGGWSLLLLSLFYYVIDVKGYKKWAFFFRIIGMNSILIYVSGRFIDWGYATRGLFGWLGELIGDPWNLVILAICYVMVKWTFLYILYRKDVFLRV